MTNSQLLKRIDSEKNFLTILLCRVIVLEIIVLTETELKQMED